jgi:RimJ/RimL family protein N-acetyltransferase
MRGGEDEEEFEFSALILTRRLLLRPPDQGDLAAITVLSRNPRVAENLAASPGERRGDFSGSFAVVEKDGGAVVGATAYGPMPSRPAAVEIATLIGEPHWGRGYATEATQALIDRIFADGRILVLWCSNRASNLRARRVVEKCGFQFREAGMERSPSGRAMPVERFVLERRNWTSLKAWGAGPGRPRKDRFDAPRDNAA